MIKKISYLVLLIFTFIFSFNCLAMELSDDEVSFHHKKFEKEIKKGASIKIINSEVLFFWIIKNTTNFPKEIIFEIVRLANSPDYRLLTVDEISKKIVLWDVELKKRIKCWQFNLIALVSPDNKKIIMDYWNEDVNCLCLINTITGNVIKEKRIELPLEQGAYSLAAFSDDSKEILLYRFTSFTLTNTWNIVDDSFYVVKDQREDFEPSLEYPRLVKAVFLISILVPIAACILDLLMPHDRLICFASPNLEGLRQVSNGYRCFKWSD